MSRRPTPEQLASYEAKFDATGQPAFLKGISIVGDFMADCMEEAGFPEEDIEPVCFMLGRLCMGRDPWAAFDLLWKKVEDDLAEKERRKTYADTVVEQHVPEATDLFTEYLTQVQGFCGDKGIFPQPLLYRDLEGKLTLMAVAADGNECVRHARKALKEGVEEMVFGLDRSAAPGQGLEFNDFVTVVWYVGGEFYTAVINYVPAEDKADQIIRDPDWANNWWNNQMRATILPDLRAILETTP